MPSGTPFGIDEINKLKRDIVEFIADGLNITLSSACQQVHVNRTTVHAWLNDDPMFKADVAKAKALSVDNGLDLAENKLMGLIHTGDRKSIMYFLDRKGGERNYNPKIINENKDVTPPPFVQDFGGVTPDVPTPAA